MVKTSLAIHYSDSDILQYFTAVRMHLQYFASKYFNCNLNNCVKLFWSYIVQFVLYFSIFCTLDAVCTSPIIFRCIVYKKIFTFHRL